VRAIRGGGRHRGRSDVGWRRRPLTRIFRSPEDSDPLVKPAAWRCGKQDGTRQTIQIDGREELVRRPHAVPEKVSETCKYCAPLLFINSLAVAGLADLPTAVDALNGTVTFIRFESKTYAITAQHVVKLLREKAAQAHPGGWLFSTLLGIRGQSLVDRYVPAFRDSFKQPSAQHPDEYDVALTEINEGFLEAIGKVAVLFERDANNEEVRAFAVGYPTEGKFDVVDGWGRSLGLRCVQAVADRASAVCFYSEIQQRPSIGRLRGMSGGPVFCVRDDELSLLGIAIEALDFDPETNNGGSDSPEGLSKGPRVAFAIQPMNTLLLRSWVAELSTRDCIS
jgi:hypothetical protein